MSLSKMYNFKKIIFIFALIFLVSCLCSFISVSAEAPKLQNNGFVLEDNMVYQNVGSKINIKANNTNNPSGTYYRFIVSSFENTDMEIISDSQSAEAVWVPKKFGTYGLFMDVYTPGDNDSKITHFLEVFVLENRDGIDNLLEPSQLVAPGFTPDIPNFDSNTVEEAITLNKYIGIRNAGGTCSLDSALQLLYNDDAFKGLILGLEDLDEEKTPYLVALKEQFIRMDKSTDKSVDLLFTKDQQMFLIAVNGDFSMEFDGVEWAETRLLNKCIEECKASGRNAVADNIMKLLCFDKKDVAPFCDGADNKLYSSILVADNIDMLKLSIEGKIESCRYLPKTINLVCIDTNMRYYNFYDIVKNASKIELSDGRVFELQGVVMHPDGHYYSVVKNSESDSWVMLDDTNVLSLSKDVISDGDAVQLTYREVR